ncbi:MAG: S1 family peptidase [Candidatus Paceibacterota bacterium]
MTKLGISLLLSIVLAAPSHAITYPDSAVDSEAGNYVVGLFYNETPGEYAPTEKAFCSGVLYADVVVITAAHCVKGLKHENILVSNPGASFDSEYYFHQAVSIITHERYSKSGLGVNDIALVLLAGEFQGSYSARIADAGEAKFLEAKNLAIFGYGLDQNGDQPDGLRMAKVSLQNTSAKRYYAGFNIKTNIAVGKYNKKDKVFSGACFGDSGGPLISKYQGEIFLIGISSYVSRDCNAKYPSVYMRASSYKGWVESNVERLKRSGASSSYDFTVNDEVNDSDSSERDGRGADILRVSGSAVTGKGLVLDVYYNRRYSNTDIGIGVYIFIDDDSKFDYELNEDGSVLVSKDGRSRCAVMYDEYVSGGSEIIRVSIDNACFVDHYWVDVQIVISEEMDQPGYKYYLAEDVADVSGIFLNKA